MAYLVHLRLDNNQQLRNSILHCMTPARPPAFLGQKMSPRKKTAIHRIIQGHHCQRRHDTPTLSGRGSNLVLPVYMYSASAPPTHHPRPRSTSQNVSSLTPPHSPLRYRSSLRLECRRIPPKPYRRVCITPPDPRYRRRYRRCCCCLRRRRLWLE